MVTGTKNKSFRIQMKLYDPEGRKIHHDEISLPLGFELEDAIKVFLAAKVKAVDDGGAILQLKSSLYESMKL